MNKARRCLSRKKRFSGFSLIELAVSILVIGILVAGVVAGGGFISKYRVTAAQVLTTSSPINGISDGGLWLEGTLEKSFATTESQNGADLSAWNDIKNSSAVQLNASAVAVGGNSPKFANDLNSLYAPRFSGNGYFTIDGSLLNNTAYTIFVLESRKSSVANNYFLGDSSNTASNGSLLLGYNSETGVIHSQSGSSLTNATTANVDSYSNYGSKPRIFTFISDPSVGKKTYVNGTLAAQDLTNTSNLTGITTLAIGKGYFGAIGELVIFTKSLKNEDRKAVEDYLAKKWSVKLIRDISSNCTSGVVSDSGCKQVCPVSIVGVSSPTTISDGATQSFSCNATGYAGTTAQSYTCSNGALTPTPTATACSVNGCAANYENVAGVCQAIFCSVPANVGTNTASVNQSTGTVACDKSGYSGGPASYSCVAGNFSVTANACSSGPKCTGGDTSTYTVAGEKIHLFTSGTYTLSCTQAVNASILIIGGGGGGGGNYGGGGGAGGFVEVTAYGQNIPIGDYTVTVGSGGTGSQGYTQNASNGGPSSISGLGLATALGGGAGGTSNATKNGATGGSGGGDYISAASSVGGAGTVGQGNNGGKVVSAASGSGGGGGAGGVGGDGGTNPGNGGSGKTSTITGSTQTYAGGGGGGNYNVSYRSSGGSGGGGRGGNSSSTPAENATGYGSGGGGAYGASQTSKGGNGSAGVVIVRYTN